MACSSRLEAHALPLNLVTTIVASFSSVVASAACFFPEDSADALRAASWSDVAVALDIIGNLLVLIIQNAESGGCAAEHAISQVKLCFENVAKMCLCFPIIEPSDHSIAHVAAWNCLSNCCVQALRLGQNSFASGFVLNLLQQVDVLSLLLKR
jgi:hypothetical protein